MQTTVVKHLASRSTKVVAITMSPNNGYKPLDEPERPDNDKPYEPDRSSPSPTRSHRLPSRSLPVVARRVGQYFGEDPEPVPEGTCL